MAVIPANTELDLKALAAVSGDRRIHLVPVKELQKLTGYIRGGVNLARWKENISSARRSERRICADIHFRWDSGKPNSACAGGLHTSNRCGLGPN